MTSVSVSKISAGLKVRARHTLGVLKSNKGKLATVTSIDGNRVFYTYDHSGWGCDIQARDFWMRFERVETDNPTGVAATAGHCAGTGGLRGNSVGDVFPVVVYQRGNPDSLTHWLRLPDGRDIGPYFNYDDVHSAAAWHKSQL